MAALLRLGARGTPPDDPGRLERILFEFAAPPEGLS